MANLYITSAEILSGKSALCVGLGIRFKADGLRAGYMKPVNVNCQVRDGLAFDNDVVFAKKIFELPDPPALLGPVALTPAKRDQQLRGPETDYEPKLLEAFAKVSADRDVMLLEGGRSWREGYMAGLPPRHVVKLLKAQALIMLKYNENVLVDRALAAQDYFDGALIGVVVNQTPNSHMERMHEAVAPFLARRGLPVLGVLPRERLLAAPTVAELAEGLRAEILCAEEHTDGLVEDMLVGAMNVEAALTYFRRRPNKAVITGGDRADIQLAALETPTRCLILTGNLYPNPMVINRADELGVPVLLVDMDTVSVIEVVEEHLGRGRFQQPQKIERFNALLNQNFNFKALYESLGLRH